MFNNIIACVFTDIEDDYVDEDDIQETTVVKNDVKAVDDKDDLRNKGDERSSTDDVVVHEDLENKDDEIPSTDAIVDDEDLQSEDDEKPSPDDVVDDEDLQSEDDERPSTDDVLDDEDLQNADDDRGSTDDELVDKDDQQIEGANRGINEDLNDNIKDVESINVNIDQPKEIVYLNNPKDDNDDIYDPQCTIPVLKKSSLFRLGKQLSVEECFKLGEKLNISEKKLLNIKSKPDVKNAVFEIWRPIRPNETLVSRLVQALTNINKREEADAVNNAFAENIEFRP